MKKQLLAICYFSYIFGLKAKLQVKIKIENIEFGFFEIGQKLNLKQTLYFENRYLKH